MMLCSWPNDAQQNSSVTQAKLWLPFTFLLSVLICCFFIFPTVINHLLCSSEFVPWYKKLQSLALCCVSAVHFWDHIWTQSRLPAWWECLGQPWLAVTGCRLCSSLCYPDAHQLLSSSSPCLAALIKAPLFPGHCCSPHVGGRPRAAPVCFCLPPRRLWRQQLLPLAEFRKSLLSLCSALWGELWSSGRSLTAEGLLPKAASGRAGKALHEGQARAGGQKGEFSTLCCCSLTSSAVVGATIEGGSGAVRECPKEAVKMLKGLEQKPYKEQLRSLSLFSLEKSEGEPHCKLQLPPEEKSRGRHWFLLSGDQQQELGQQHGAVRGGSDRILEKAREWLGTATGSQGCPTAPSLPQPRRVWTSLMATWGVTLGVSCVRPAGGFLVGPFQLRWFYDSMTIDDWTFPPPILYKVELIQFLWRKQDRPSGFDSNNGMVVAKPFWT